MNPPPPVGLVLPGQLSVALRGAESPSGVSART
jgi:hypothetical protein